MSHTLSHDTIKETTKAQLDLLRLSTSSLRMKSSAFTAVNGHKWNMLAEQGEPQRIFSRFVYFGKRKLSDETGLDV